MDGWMSATYLSTCLTLLYAYLTYRYLTYLTLPPYPICLTSPSVKLDPGRGFISPSPSLSHTHSLSRLVPVHSCVWNNPRRTLPLAHSHTHTHTLTLTHQMGLIGGPI